MESLRKELSTNWPEIKSMGARLASIRVKLKKLDQLTYAENVVTGFENHQFLVSSSDFDGDPDAFEKELDQILVKVQGRPPRRDEIRLGYLGVPPIFTEFYEFIESLDARVVFNEVQRQFSMPFHEEGIVEQYLQYTYPYPMSVRLKDIKGAIMERQLDGLIHYTQTFCYRQIYDIVLRELMPIPLLTLEGDRPGPVDGRTALRIETFVEMLRAGKEELG
jgi:benzoyl-CoA reductase/2-hydroxyglutaryl-CoA dehydratase subunit BcrC/BadD/HgdB